MLIPNTTYNINGVTINEKIIPDGTVWKNATLAQAAGFRKGDLYKRQAKINNGKPLYVTIHNTNDLANVADDAEQYTRATYNECMGSARVHFYVDDKGAWQNLKAGTSLSVNDPVGSAEISWHAGDGSAADGGNYTSLSIEIIMGESATADAKAKDNGAKIAAWLLYKYGLDINHLVSHTYWVNKKYGKTFADVDEQCTNMIVGQKWCPAYIFDSNNHTTALKNWKAFKSLVLTYLNQYVNPVTVPAIKNGDIIKLVKGAKYTTGKTIPDWVLNSTLYARSAVGKDNTILFSLLKAGAITGSVDIKYLATPTPSTNVPYLIKVTADALNVRSGPGTSYKVNTVIKKNEVYTIVEEKNGWGKLKSGAGWIGLSYTIKV